MLDDGGGWVSGALRLPSFTTGNEIYLKRLTLLLQGGHIGAVFYPVPDHPGHASAFFAPAQSTLLVS
jgi:hypothetical protein